MEGLSEPGNSRFPDKTRLMGKYELRMLKSKELPLGELLKGNRSRGPLYEKRFFILQRTLWVGRMSEQDDPHHPRPKRKGTGLGI